MLPALTGEPLEVVNNNGDGDDVIALPRTAAASK